jgi:YggT family protein
MIVIEPIFRIIDIALQMYVYVVIAAAILSWLVTFNVVNTRNQVVYQIGNALYRLTEPALRPIRRILPGPAWPVRSSSPGRAASASRSG